MTGCVSGKADIGGGLKRVPGGTPYPDVPRRRESRLRVLEEVVKEPSCECQAVLNPSRPYRAIFQTVIVES